MLNTKRDTQMLLLALFACASVASGAVARNEANEIQLPNNEKGQPLGSPGLFGHNQKVIANDLLEQPEVEPADRRQQQQQQHRLVSQGVINGNHATYVEPPADFKPIIYDHDKQRGHHSQTYRIEYQMPNESSEAANQPSSPISSSSSQPRQQQPQQHSHMATASGRLVESFLISSAGSDGSSDSIRPLTSSQAQASAHQWQAKVAGRQADKIEEAQFVPALKPSIGRWNDWHDMTIEPDLASSDSSASLYSVQHSAVPFAFYRTHYGPKPNYRAAQGTKGGGSLPAGLIEPGLAGHKQPPRAVDQVEGSEQLGSGQKIGRIVAGNQELVKQGAVAAQHQQQTKGGQASGLATATSVQSGLVNGANLPLNPISQDNSIKMQASELASNQLEPSPALNQLVAKAPQPPNHQRYPKRRLKRRRKSKTNAEVRILQLVASSQQQELAAKQVNGLAANQFGEQTKRQQQPTDQHQVDQPQASDVYEQKGQQQQQRSLDKHQRARMSPPVLKRFGGFSVANSSSLGGTNANARRVVKRRRIKTLLPVGLSSWFLGGIRDLDGRHWQLPASVIGRLAVNDVDFNYANQPPRIVPPSEGSVIIITAQSADSVESTSQSPTTQHIPISHLIPR